ncbi:MAG TPA: cytochrome b N-terminal domain-containing protein [Gaiellaceae bacterium]|nr:cytochrome b N-terminal domain-containing protein [Gaiellaceae bacterium]
MSRGAPVTRRAVRWLDQRSGAAPFLRKTLRYLFPDHWSFLLGEVALYAFAVLVATGIYLTFFFVDSTKEITYHGAYVPLQGQRMSEAYASVVNISLTVKAGLLIRQTHHWAANVFIAAIVLHLFRVFFTGAYRKPRGLTYALGVTMLMLSLLEAYMGYSLVDDLLSGMGLIIGYSVGLSLPFVGANLMSWLFHGPYPGQDVFWPRMYIAHVFLFPLLIGTLLVAHLVLVAMKHHTQFRRRKAQTEHAIVGVPTWPGQTPRSVGLALATAGVLFLLGGLVEINPIWLWGPYHTYSSTNGAQPDWYLGWLIGGLRLVPSFDFTIGSYTVVPNAFWGGAAFPLVVFGFLYFWPWIERRITGDDAFHNLLERPRDNPLRTGIGVGMVSWVVLVFLAGGSDRVYVLFGITYTSQIWVYRVLVFVLPPVLGWLAWWWCRELQRSERVEAERHEAEAEARLARLRHGSEPPGDPGAVET